MRVLVGNDARLGPPEPDDAGTAELEDLEVSAVGAVQGPLADPDVDDGLALLDHVDHLSVIDRLTLTWTGELDGLARALTQTVEVVDGHYTSLRELRRHPDLAATRPEQLIPYRDGFARLVERYRGASWVGALDVAEGYLVDAGHALDVGVADVREIVSVTGPDGDVDLDGGDVTTSAGSVHGLAVGRYTIVFRRGLTETMPEQLPLACAEYVRAAVLDPGSGIPRNALSWSDGQGGTYRTSTADWSAGRPTGLMSVDDLLNQVEDFRALP